MFDGSAGWDYVTSMRFGRVLEECGFLWYEEPMREFELGSYRKLCDALDIPVLAAETSDGCHWNMATWIQMGALDMTRVNTNFKGGFTGSMKIAHLSDSHGMRCQVHGMGLGQRAAVRRHPRQRLLRAARHQRRSDRRARGASESSRSWAATSKSPAIRGSATRSTGRMLSALRWRVPRHGHRGRDERQAGFKRSQARHARWPISRKAASGPITCSSRACS